LDNSVESLDALIIGAGVTGLYQLHALRKLGLNAKIYEAGSGVGGTWYWNRYPGARFDSESYTYGYEFSEELLQEWDWKEHFSGQPETERYLNYVADKFELRPHIQFHSKITAASYNAATNRWEVETDDGRAANAQFLIAAVGILSAHHMPDIAGIESFQGTSFHTSRWPKEPVDFSTKRVGIIGSGATAVQLIPEMAKMAGHLSVFQRSPNWCLPLRNGPITDEEQARIKGSYADIFKRCRETYAGFIHDADPRSAFDVNDTERRAFYEEIWAQPGFAKWHANFSDIMVDERANETYCEFIREKIRARVDDPEIAYKLIPTDHACGARRVPLETNYYETYNRADVSLVDVREHPIKQITPQGIMTAAGHHELDVIIYATGFDAITGELTRMNVRGESGRTLEQAWSDGPTTYLTVMTPGFPNLFIANGAVFCNVPRCAEVVVEWIRDCLDHMQRNELHRIETTAEAAQRWTEDSDALTRDFLFDKADVKSWFMGTNIPGKARTFSLYAGGAPMFRDKCEHVATSNYEGFVLK